MFGSPLDSDKVLLLVEALKFGFSKNFHKNIKITEKISENMQNFH